MDSEHDASRPGPLDSLRALGATFLALIGTRAELLVVELREEGERRKEMLVLAGVAAVFLALGLLLVAFFVVVLFWDTHRIVATAAVTLTYLGIGAGALARLRQKARSSPPPFEATLAEFAKDLEMLKKRDE
ncbi:MAG TPA: phage holin family protein [Usitatibacter sp.]